MVIKITQLVPWVSSIGNIFLFQIITRQHFVLRFYPSSHSILRTEINKLSSCNVISRYQPIMILWPKLIFKPIKLKPIKIPRKRRNQTFHFSFILKTLKKIFV